MTWPFDVGISTGRYVTDCGPVEVEGQSYVFLTVLEDDLPTWESASECVKYEGQPIRTPGSMALCFPTIAQALQRCVVEDTETDYEGNTKTVRRPMRVSDALAQGKKILKDHAPVKILGMEDVEDDEPMRKIPRGDFIDRLDARDYAALVASDDPVVMKGVELPGSYPVHDQGGSTGMNLFGRYLLNVLIGIDQLGNAMLFGDPDETISSRLGKIAHRNGGEILWTRPMCKIIAWGLDRIDKDHCTDAIENDEGKDALWY